MGGKRWGTGWLAGLWEPLRSFWVGGEGILPVVSLFVSQARLGFHLLTLWEAHVGTGLHPGGAEQGNLTTGAGESMRFSHTGPSQLYHLRPVTLCKVIPALLRSHSPCKDQEREGR